MTPFNPKPRPCKQCATLFVPARPLQAVCSPKCATKKVKADKAAERSKLKAEKSAAREKLAKRKEAIKTIPQLIKEAQDEFNAYIRLRDAGLPCICCGRPFRSTELGGSADAGHYRSRGSAGHLRFNEDNCHAQRKQCNRYGAGRAVDYRIGLIARIGLERVLDLESDNTPHKWTADELRAIRATYREKAKQLKRERKS